MRVSQIQNLTWAGNVLVLGGVVWAGLLFWGIKNAKPPAEPAWAKAKTDDVGKQRWPGDASAFDVIKTTPINGAVPKPVVKDPVVIKPDKTTEFKNKLKYVSGVIYPENPEISQARVSYDGKEMWIQPGDEVAGTGFRIVEFTLVAGKPAAPAGGGTPVKSDQPRIAHMGFKNPDNGEVLVIEQPDPTGQSLVAGGGPLIVPAADLDSIKRGRISENGPLPGLAVQNTNGDWIIPDDEQLWIEVWGEKDLLPKLGMKPETDQAGNPRGVRITSQPEAATPLAASHGININDIVRSINKVAVNSKEEILEYLRGPGRGLKRYEVVVETNGAERTVVYHVPRHAKTSHD